MEKLYRELNTVLEMLESGNVSEDKNDLRYIINKVHHEKY